MKYLIATIGILLVSCNQKKTEPNQPSKAEYAIVIHGGAGYMTQDKFQKDKIDLYHKTLNDALDIGEKILDEGGSSLDAVEKTINFMEDSPIFNSGKGAVFAHNRKNSLDASIMSGIDRNAGAVGGVSVVKNPISAARAVMEKSVHVMLSGKGADSFCKEIGLEIVDPKYFFTQNAWDNLQSAISQEQNKTESKDKHGTVGCVALDRNGNIAAGTSTGGMTNKKWDRIGDSPIIGAGTYADNKTCGVSATGHGEYFIRNTVARDIAAIMEYKTETLEYAADYIINDVLVKAGGDGGIVALDKFGNISMSFNTSGMYRGYRKPGEGFTKIFKEN